MKLPVPIIIVDRYAMKLILAVFFFFIAENRISIITETAVIANRGI